MKNIEWKEFVEVAYFGSDAFMRYRDRIFQYGGIMIHAIVYIFIHGLIKIRVMMLLKYWKLHLIRMKIFGESFLMPKSLTGKLLKRLAMMWNSYTGGKHEQLFVQKSSHVPAQSIRNTWKV